MTNIFVSLFGGVAAICMAFVLLYRFSRFDGKTVSLIMALLVILIYMPYVVIRWPGADVFAIHIALYLVTVYVLSIIAVQRDAQKSGSGQASGWFHWGPATIVVFFAIVITVNSFYMMLAQRGIDSRVASWLLPEPASGAKVVSRFAGTVPREHQSPEEFSEMQRRMEDQRERNWQINKGWVGEARSGKPALFQVTAHDAQDRPVLGAQVVGQFLRPGNSQLDQSFMMQELPDEPGSYVVEVLLPEPGRWHLLLQLRSRDTLHEITASTTITAGE